MATNGQQTGTKKGERNVYHLKETGRQNEEVDVPSTEMYRPSGITKFKCLLCTFEKMF